MQRCMCLWASMSVGMWVCPGVCAHALAGAWRHPVPPSVQVAVRSEAVCAARVSRRMGFPTLARISGGYHGRRVALL